MRKDRNAFLAGVFILASAALAVGIVVSIEGSSRFLEPEQTLWVRFKLSDNIGGLGTGDEVRIGGGKVGAVKSIDFDDNPGGDPTIAVRFTMPRRFVVHQDANLSIESSFTGVSVLNFKTLGTGPVLADGSWLGGKPTPSLMSAIDSLTPEIKGTLTDIRTQVIPRVTRVLDHADEAAADLDDVLGTGKGDLKETIADIHAVTASARERVPELLRRIDSAADKLGVVLDRTADALVDLKQVAANARSISGTARSLLTDNRSRIDQMILSLKTTGDNLKYASAEIRRNPWRLLYHPAPNEMANLNLFDAAREFAEGAAAMQDAATALRDASKDPATDPKKLKQLQDQLDDTFDNFSKVEQKLWNAVKQ